jgi:hypothetical protein
MGGIFNALILIEKIMYLQDLGEQPDWINAGVRVNREELRKKAKARFRQAEALRQDPRYLRVLGTLVRAGLLVHNRIRPYRGTVTVDDALWAGELEPRVHELLPAVLLKRPRLFVRTGRLPDDLAAVLNDLRRGEPRLDFRGIPARNYAVWVGRVGRAGKRPSLLKTFRFAEADVRQLRALQELTGDSEIDVIRKGMALLLRSRR